MAGVKRKKLDFVAAGKRKDTRDARENIRLAAALSVPILMVLFFGAQYMTYAGSAGMKEEQAAVLKSSLSRTELIEEMREMEILETTVSELETYRLNLEGIHDYLNSKTEITGAVAKTVFDAGEGKVGLEVFSYKNDVLSLSGIVTDYRDVSLYIQRLEDAGCFSQISYHGFSGEREGPYSFEVTAKLK